jgi:sulfite dehydrogenase (cytochrome) subunit B
MVRTIACILLTLALAGAALAQKKSITLPEDNPTAQLKPGPGAEATHNNCFICHSTDYIVRQPRLDAKRWEAEVNKMIKVFAAPISESDAKAIVDYLGKNYGPVEEEGGKQKAARKKQ